jgi:hypothetical protein
MKPLLAILARGNFVTWDTARRRRPGRRNAQRLAARRRERPLSGVGRAG